jgi:putative ABC transport system permease protein
MKFFPIVLRNLGRRKFRTIFTIGAVFFAFLLFGVLMAIRSAFNMGVDMAGQSRLMTMDKVSIINPLPASYEQQLRMLPGVTDVTHANWFGGYYQDVRNQFATFATEPESWLRVYSREYELPEDQKNAFYADRTGRSSAATAKKYGSRSDSASRSTARSTAGPTWPVSSRSTASTTRTSRGPTDAAAVQLPVPARDDPGGERIPRPL